MNSAPYNLPSFLENVLRRKRTIDERYPCRYYKARSRLDDQQSIMIEATEEGTLAGYLRWFVNDLRIIIQRQAFANGR